MSRLDGYPIFIKCVVCLRKKSDFVPEGILAKDALAVFNGKSLCYEHFAEELEETIASGKHK